MSDTRQTELVSIYDTEPVTPQVRSWEANLQTDHIIVDISSSNPKLTGTEVSITADPNHPDVNSVRIRYDAEVPALHLAITHLDTAAHIITAHPMLSINETSPA